jgi:hypothetical protein
MWTDKPGTSGGGFDPTTPLTFILMVSPDGTVWSMSVDNTGAWVAAGSQTRLTEAGDVRLTEAGTPRTVEG